MGKGCDYRRKYPHFMLFDDNVFNVPIGDYELTATFDEDLTEEKLEQIKASLPTSAKYERQDDSIVFSFDNDEDLQGFVTETKLALESLENCDVEIDEPGTERDEDGVWLFLGAVVSKFKAHQLGKNEYRREGTSYVFAETEHLEIGIDTGGDLHCLWVRPKWYSDDGEEVPYVIDRTVQNAFNELIGDYEEGFFSFPTGPYSYEPLAKYERISG